MVMPIKPMELKSCLVYKAATTTPIPNSAAIPIAPLGMLPAAAAVIVLALGAVVVAEIPLVKGTAATEEAPAKATGCVVAVGLTGVAVELDGLRTLVGALVDEYKKEGRVEEKNRIVGRKRGALLVNDMHNTISHNDIRDRYLSTIHENLLIHKLNGNLGSNKRRETFVR